MIYYSNKNAGSLTLEAVLGILILSLVAVSGGISLVRISQSIAHSRQTKKAAALAENVLEYYQDKAIGSFNLMSTYNVTNQPIQTFLSLSANPGNFKITTSAAYNDIRSSCTITATLTWFDAKGANKMVFQKVYSERAAMLMGSVTRAYVKLPCDGHTDADYLINHPCPGLSRVTVTAPSVIDPSIPVQGISDINGMVILRGVQEYNSGDPPVTFTAKAPTATIFTVRTDNPSFVQGYYRVSTGTPNGIDINDSSTTFNPSQVVFMNFRIAGQVEGVIRDTLNIPVPNAGVQLYNPAKVAGDSAIPNSYRSCSASLPCVTYTNAVGHYEFNNVLPTTDVKVASDPGISGSSPTIQTSDPRFVQGYINPALNTHAAVEWASAPVGDTPEIAQNITIYKKGSLKITLSDKATGTTPPANLPSIKGSLYIIEQAYAATPWEPPFKSSMTLDFPETGASKGVTYVNNFIEANNQYSATSSHVPVVYAWIRPNGGTHLNGYFGANEGGWKCTSGNCIDAINPVVISMEPGSALSGKITNTSGVGLGNLNIRVPTGIPGPIHVDTFSNASGLFTIRGFWTHCPSFPCTTDPYTGSIYGAWSTVQGSTPVPTTLNMNAFESTSGGTRRAGELHFRVCIPGTPIVDCFSTSTYRVTGSNGISSTSEGLPYLGQPFFSLACPTQADCHVCVPGEEYMSPWCPSTGNAVVDGLHYEYLYPDPTQTGSYECGEYWGMGILTPGAPVHNSSMDCRLQRYKIQGTIRDNNGVGLANIAIYDDTINRINPIALSGVGGTYTAYLKPTDTFQVSIAVLGPGGLATVTPVTPLCVNPITSSSTGGTSTPDGTGVTCNLPDPLTPETGLRQNFTVVRVVPPGGGL